MNVNDFSEPLKLVGEGEYNINALKEFNVTDSYLGLDENIRGCQNEEPLDNCTTRHYRKYLQEKCGCVPFILEFPNSPLKVK